MYVIVFVIVVFGVASTLWVRSKHKKSTFSWNDEDLLPSEKLTNDPPPSNQLIPPSGGKNEERDNQPTLLEMTNAADPEATTFGVPALQFMESLNEDNRPPEQRRWGLDMFVNQGAHTGNTVPQGSSGGPVVVARPDIRSHLETEPERWRRLEVRQAQADRMEWYVLTLCWLDHRKGGHSNEPVLLPIGPNLEALRKYREKSQKLLPNLSRGGLHEPPFTLVAITLVIVNEDGSTDDPQVRELARQQIAAIQFPMARARLPSCEEPLLETLLPPQERISTLVT